MGTFFVVAEHPGPADISHLRERREDVRIEHYFAEASVEPLDVSVPIRLAGLDVIDPHFVLAAPFREDTCRHLGTVIDPDRFGHTSFAL